MLIFHQINHCTFEPVSVELLSRKKIYVLNFMTKKKYSRINVGPNNFILQKLQNGSCMVLNIYKTETLN